MDKIKEGDIVRFINYREGNKGLYRITYVCSCGWHLDAERIPDRERREILKGDVVLATTEKKVCWDDVLERVDKQ